MHGLVGASAGRSGADLSVQRVRSGPPSGSFRRFGGNLSERGGARQVHQSARSRAVWRRSGLFPGALSAAVRQDRRSSGSPRDRSSPAAVRQECTGNPLGMNPRACSAVAERGPESSRPGTGRPTVYQGYTARCTKGVPPRGLSVCQRYTRQAGKGTNGMLREHLCSASRLIRDPPLLTTMPEYPPYSYSPPAAPLPPAPNPRRSRSG